VRFYLSSVSSPHGARPEPDAGTYAKCLTLTEETTDDYKGHCCYRFWNRGHIPHVGVFSGGGMDLEARQFLGLRLFCSRINRSFEIA
jgi:hypothetical protein